MVSIYADPVPRATPLFTSDASPAFHQTPLSAPRPPDRYNEQVITLSDIRAARDRIAGVASVTPLIDVSAQAGRALFLKCENMQPCGAFKIRGAYNMVAQLTTEERQRGVITYSSGNHGQAMALAARQLGAPAVVGMPKTAPRGKGDGPGGVGRAGIFV